ncbi:MAG: Ig-like domain-containing protein, partial [Cyclobacteriaceae bacterium]|nr:Ig-like domain-containing protein [Cyclobacteriaceae bacterium]
MRRLITAFAFFLSCPTLLFAQAPGPATGFVVDYTGTTPSVIKLNWVAPSPATNLTSYLILASDVGFGSITDPTNGFTVSNLTNLSGGSGAFNAGLVLTYNGFTGITAGKQYFFKIYAYNNAGAGPPTYAAAATATGFAEPAQATNIVFSNRQATTLTVNWTNGGSAGASRIVVGRATSAVTFTPSDGTPLTGASGTPSTDFTDAVNGDLGGNRLLFSGSGSGPINITNLSAGVTYYFVVLEFSGSGTLINYNIATATGNPANRTTLPAQPTSEVTGVTLTSNAVGAAAITWSVNGNGANRIIVGKKNTIDGTPSDETTYTSNASFGSGTQIGTGNYVVYNNNSPNNRTVTNLQNGTYQFQFFEYNGTGGNENYLVPATNTYTVATEPSAQPTLPVVSNFLNDGTGYDVSWTAVPNTPNPTVDGYIVIRKQGSAPGTDPTDGTTYNVNDVIVAGETVEYVGSATLFSDAGLTAGTQYFYNIYSYNGTGTNINYRQAGSPLSVNRFTLPAEPSAQSAGAMASASQTSSQIRDITFPAATGTPSGYLVVRKSGSNYGTLPTPVDGDLPTVGSTLGEGVVVWNGALPTSNNFDDTSGLLGAQTQYYAVFSYNQAGSGGAASYNFLSTSPLTGNFTTDCTEPTVQPGAMTFSGTSTTSTNVNFTRGNGTGGVIIMAKQGSAPNPPSQGNTYSAGVNNDFSLATDIGGGTKVVYRGVASGASTATSRPVSGLLPNTQYFFAAYEYNSTLSCYNLISPSANDVTTLGFVTVVTNTTSNATGSLNSSSTNNVLLGFSATTAGNTTNLTGITITTSTTVTSKFTRLGIWESSDNTFGSDTEIGFVNNPTGTTIAFSGLSSALSGTTKYYFIVANIGPYVTSSTAAVQVTFSPTTGGNMTFSSANTPAGADVVGTNYSFVDVTPPVINSVARSNGNVFLGGLTQIITVTYDEPMNSGTSPTITFSPSTNFTPSVGAWSGGNTIWTQTFTHTGASETVPTETVTALGASDVSGNANVVSNNNTFAIDTKKPQATVTISTDPITISSNTQTVTVTYDEPMNTGSTPTITFVPANGNFTAPAGSWNGPGTQFTRTFTHNPTQETVVGQTVSVANTSGATDIAGNADLGATSPGFLIDTKPPKLTNISSANLNATYTTGAVIAIDVTFDEIVNVTATPTLTLNAGGGATASYVSGTGTTILTFNYTVGAIGSGQNTTDLNVTAIAGTIQDQRLNNFDNTLPGSANLANNKDIAIDTQRPTVLTVRSTTASGFYNAGKIINIAMTFDEPVNITGFPVLALNTTPAANATYFSGSGTTVITFRYTVGATENSAYLDYVNTSSLSLAGGAIKDLVAIDATLTLPGLGANSIFPNRDVVIDTTPPVLSSVLPVDDKFAVPLGGNLTINLNDANTNIQKNTLTGTAFRLKRISDNAVIGNIDATSSAISVSGGQAVINLAAASVVPVAGEAYYVEIDNGALLDIAGNPYAGFMNNSSWNFQMYSVPSLTGTSDIVGTKACVGQNITVNGKYFSGYNTLQGIASVTFYDNAGGNATVTSSGITVINDTQLSVLVPPTATINTQTKIKITSKNEGPIPGLGSNVGGISANFSQLVDLGPTSAQMSLSTLGAFEVCDNGSIISRNVKVTVT